MALSNAERQARHRQKQKEKGLVYKLNWTDKEGFTSPAEHGMRSRISRNKMAAELTKLTQKLPMETAEEIYAELLAVARRLCENYKNIS